MKRPKYKGKKFVIPGKFSLDSLSMLLINFCRLPQGISGKVLDVRGGLCTLEFYIPRSYLIAWMFKSEEDTEKLIHRLLDCNKIVVGPLNGNGNYGLTYTEMEDGLNMLDPLHGTLIAVQLNQTREIFEAFDFDLRENRDF